MYMWMARKFYPIEGIGILSNKSLVKISDDDIVSIHEQLLAVGRELVRQESPLILGNRSRLWNPEGTMKQRGKIIFTKYREVRMLLPSI
ncbi:hypothetical protein MLD38_005604 [Melastoma candidum]|uniref:Uncharacterized protein n=1 Tax=Melastoma candidum TaxID=119954 RepID=A0ACB9RM51_9MYRT|nr:hypothetical protein MLD38_005604 [Melastoma candidum]